jgi:predicted ATP-grasp superfamily ATP-dependent carboligase
MRVLVTNCTRNSGLSVIRALTAHGFDVLGADDRRSPFGLRSRHVVAPYLLLPPQDSPHFAATLLEALEQVRPDVFIPTRGIRAAVQLRQEILQRTHALLPTPAAFDAINDKAQLLAHCQSLRIAAPRIFEPDEAASWLRSSPGTRVVVKPRIDIGGGTGVHFVDEAGELASIHARTAAAYGGAIITEYVPGPVTNLHAAHLLFDDESRLVAFFVLQKLRIWPAQVGVTVAAVSTHQTELVEQILPLFEAVRWRGPAEAEFKIDERDGRAMLLEINPRFSGAIQFPLACGVDLPGLLCRTALGERLPRADGASYDAGVHYVDVMRWGSAVLNEIRAERVSRRTVIARAAAEVRGPRVRSVHSLSDPAPSIAKLWLGFLPTTSYLDSQPPESSRRDSEPRQRG